jgi:hypothetical protein
MRGSLVKVEVSGENPTHDQPEGNDGVHLNGMHEIDAYGFQDGKTHGLIVFNYGLHATRRVSIEAAGLNANSDAKVWRLVSSGPGSSNEQEAQVTVKEERLNGTELDLAPCSMVAVEWSE